MGTKTQTIRLDKDKATRTENGEFVVICRGREVTVNVIDIECEAEGEYADVDIFAGTVGIIKNSFKQIK